MQKALLALGALLLFGSAQAQGPDEAFMIRTSENAPDAVVAAIESYSGKKGWLFLGANKVKKGQVTLVKICIPEIGQMVWQAGLQLSALLPCGNIGVYQKDGVTEISVLHPGYMHTLYPSPETEQAATAAEPLLSDMLDTVTR